MTGTGMIRVGWRICSPSVQHHYLSMRERMGWEARLVCGSSLRDASPARTGVAAHAYAALITYAAVMPRASTRVAFAGVFNLHITRAKLQTPKLQNAGPARPRSIPKAPLRLADHPGSSVPARAVS